MKSTYFFILLLALGLFTACENGAEDDPADDVIWDFICYSMWIEVTDEAGNDLLDPATAGNILGDPIRVVYEGKSYSRDTSVIQTRFLPPQPLALRYCQAEGTGQYRMAFGEFTPTANYENEPFRVEWGDGTADEISFDCYITWDGEEPNVHKRIYLNGELQEGENYVVRIVK